MASGEATEQVKGYTALLLVFFFGLGTAAMMMHELAGRAEEDAWTLRMVRNFQIAMAAACLAVAVLRSIGSRMAGAATIAISVVLAMWFPVGTAAFIWWLVSVRKREAKPVAAAS